MKKRNICDRAFVLDLPAVRDVRGALVAIEPGEYLPFAINRVYYIFDVPEAATRGSHAHKALEQLLICVHGQCRISLDTGTCQSSVMLDSPRRALYVGTHVWRGMSGFSRDAVLLVLASRGYDESDYIRDYEEFVRLARAKRQATGEET